MPGFNAKMGMFTPKGGSPIPAELVASWPFISDANDVSGNGHDLFENGSISYSTPEAGVANLDYLKYFSLSANPDFTFADAIEDKPFSISLKYKGSAYASGRIWLISKRQGEVSPREWQIAIVSGTLYFSLFDDINGGTLAAKTSVIFDTTTEYHIVCRYDGSGSYIGMSIYVNNVSQSISDVSSGTYIKMNDIGASSLLVGKEGWTSGGFLVGYMKLLKVYKGVLTSNEITTLYNE